MRKITKIFICSAVAGGVFAASAYVTGKLIKNSSKIGPDDLYFDDLDDKDMLAEIDRKKAKDEDNNETKCKDDAIVDPVPLSLTFDGENFIGEDGTSYKPDEVDELVNAGKPCSVFLSNISEEFFKSDNIAALSAYISFITFHCNGEKEIGSPVSIVKFYKHLKDGSGKN